MSPMTPPPITVSRLPGGRLAPTPLTNLEHDEHRHDEDQRYAGCHPGRHAVCLFILPSVATPRCRSPWRRRRCAPARLSRGGGRRPAAPPVRSPDLSRVQAACRSAPLPLHGPACAPPPPRPPP